MTHIIRLRGAWNVEPLKGNRSVRLSRHFGCSAGLKAAPQVWLTIESITGRAEINLNGHPLGTIAGQGEARESHRQCCPTKFDVTALLQPRNMLVFEVVLDASTTAAREADYLGLVQLEIE